MTVIAEGLSDYQGRKQSWCQKGDDRVRALWQFFVTDQDRPKGFDRGAGQSNA
jgi:hypothetical protein